MNQDSRTLKEEDKRHAVDVIVTLLVSFPPLACLYLLVAGTVFNSTIKYLYI
jgi:hypothetical protein